MSTCAMHHTATHCNSLQLTAPHCKHCSTHGRMNTCAMRHTATHCTTLRYAAPQCTTHGRMNTCAARPAEEVTEESRAFRLRLACVRCVAVCCSVLQCVAVTEESRAFRLRLACAAVCCGVLQCVAVCCSVLQCVAVCCSVLPPRNPELSSLALCAESPRRNEFACSIAIHCNTLQHTAAPVGVRTQSVKVSACVQKVLEETSSRAPLLPRIRARRRGHRQETAGFWDRS